MTSLLAQPPSPRSAAPRARRQRGTNLLARGEPMVWLTGGSAAAAVLMILALLAFIVGNGLTTFWPRPVELIELRDGRKIMGEPTRDEVYRITDQTTQRHRTLYKTGNYDLTGDDFTWVDTAEVVARQAPPWALLLERRSWGNAYGVLEGIIVAGQEERDPQRAWALLAQVQPQIEAVLGEIRDLEKNQIGAVAREQNRLRLELRRVELDHGRDSAAWRDKQRELAGRLAELQARFEELTARIGELRQRAEGPRLMVRTATGAVVPADRSRPSEPLLVAQIVRAVPANQLALTGRLGVYLSRWWEYLTGEPREANAEGGVWPAIFGTVLLTFIMILFVVPVGVVAAIYLREYARQGLLLSFVRISVNNLAGVPSIVFGVFGLGFFCYGIGGWIDGGPREPWSWPAWWTALVVALVLAALGAAAAVYRHRLAPGPLHRLLGWCGGSALVGVVLLAFLLVSLYPGFQGFFRERLPDPTLGKSALIWASLTLALLTLPVVIVATEEALAAVPSSMREGSYACGASKWQTIRRIVLPRAMPGIMTGAILAIARGAGEVAPLMLVGAVKLAPELPLSSSPAELFGINRSFMHLGFHIYDLGFQSRNAEAAKSMVYTTTFLLIGIVVALNLTAMWLRTRLRKTYAGGHF
jgi:phosphate transport system permease protein